jgi:putative transposase
MSRIARNNRTRPSASFSSLVTAETTATFHDRAAKFSGPFDEVSGTEEVRVIRTPIRAPEANSLAERFVRTVRSECLDHVLVYGLGHLGRVLRAYLTHHTEQRPHRGLDVATQAGMHAPPTGSPRGTQVARKDVLGA